MSVPEAKNSQKPLDEITSNHLKENVPKLLKKNLPKSSEKNEKNESEILSDQDQPTSEISSQEAKSDKPICEKNNSNSDENIGKFPMYILL